jgi:D-sedoheptulose 7-phosphate isomerase
MNPEIYRSYFRKINEVVESVEPSLLTQSLELLRKVRSNNGKVIVVGNGGSAAIASHVAVDLTKSANTRAVNFNEADLLTCFANDFGYEKWVSKAMEYYADAIDLAILISSSGASKNIVKGAATAKEMGLKVITLSGFSADNPLRQIGHVNFYAESRAYNVVEMTHHIWLLCLVDSITGNSENLSK